MSKTIKIELKRTGEKFTLYCCDCGLAHQVAAAVEKNGKIGIAMKRDQKATEVRRDKFTLRSLVWKKRR